MNNLQQLQDSQQHQEPELTIHDYWLIINRGKFWIILSTLVFLVSTVYYNYSVAPEYTASSILLIKTNSDAASIFDFSGGMNQSTIANQIELLKSRQVATNAVKNLWHSKHRQFLFFPH